MTRFRIENKHQVPKVVESLLGKDVRAIACGPGHTACITAERELYTFGAARFLFVIHPSINQSIDRSDGTENDMMCFGCSFGRLGHGHERERFIPSPVSILKGVKVVQVACGDFHTAALIDCGVVFSWGKGDDGRLGHGDEVTCLSPKQIEALNPFNIVYIACGFFSTAVITGLRLSCAIQQSHKAIRLI